MKRFWMRSLTSQWVTLMLLTLALSQLLFLFSYRDDQLRTVFLLRRDEFLSRSVSVARVVNSAEPQLRDGILNATNTASVRYWVTENGPDDSAAWQNQARHKLMESTRPPAEKDVPILGVQWENLKADDWSLDSPAKLLQLDRWNGFGLATQLAPGRWLNAVYAKPGQLMGPPAGYYISMGFTAVLLCIVSALLARRVGRPLRHLTDAAERLGRGEQTPPLPEEGADDIRRTAIAFNRMQARLTSFVEDRTRMVAAISHDLRTPITSLRLQAEFMTDEQMRDKMVATLDEMKSITEATLAFAREEATSEPTRSVDLHALLESLCEDLSSLGWDLHFSGTGALPWKCRPDGLRRALCNVIENAVRYGKRARVSTHLNDASLDIMIDDDGPGIPEVNHEKVFAPFVRLEGSRNRSTGGVGLGLTISRTILRSHGGDILLLNRGSGGLRTILRLPRD